MKFSLRLTLAFALISSLAGIASAQCDHWNPGFENTGPDYDVFCMASFDDGSGPNLYIGGNFTTVASVPMQGVARSNGTSWSGLGAGVDGTVMSLIAFDDGSGPALYVGGMFTHVGGLPDNVVARWKGGAWSTIGSSLTGAAKAFVVHDDGSGPHLYMGGDFTLGSVTSGVLRWDGTNWQPVPGILGGVEELASFDAGQGHELYAGGTPMLVGQLGETLLARWNGIAWTRVLGPTQPVRAMGVFSDGTGTALYVSAQFNTATVGVSDSLQRWNGTSWTALGSGVGLTYIDSLLPFDDGSGPKLYASGGFNSIAGVQANNLASWDGSSWHALGSGTDSWTRCLTVHDEGLGATLFAGGNFNNAGSVGCARVARWSHSIWSAVGAGPGNGLSEFGGRLLVRDDGSGSKLVAAGSFQSAGATTAHCIAEWNGSHWSPLGDGLSKPGSEAEIFALAASGTDLYAAGGFSGSGATPLLNVARWDGTSWSALGTGLPGPVYTLALFDAGQGPQLYAGGLSNQAPLHFISKWNGITWTPIGGQMNGYVDSLVVHDDGSGPALYAGGAFTIAGTTPVANAARWNGSQWSSLGPTGSGLSGRVTAMCVFDDGNGKELYAGGTFASASGVPLLYIARWDGAHWFPVGGGTDGYVSALGVHDDGDGLGAELIVGGEFTMAGTTPANGIAAWNGTSWRALGSGLGYLGGGTSLSVASFDDGQTGTPALFVSGHFHEAGGTPSEGIARWQGCGHPGLPYCFGDTGNCPCAATGTSGHGCPSSNDPSGALLDTNGVPSLSHDTLSFVETGSPNASKLLFQGTTMVAAGNGAPFGDGLRCVGGTTNRLYLHVGSGGPAVFPSSGERAVSMRGGVSSPGYRTYQVWYRDPAPFCTPAAFNLTNGVRILWTP